MKLKILFPFIIINEVFLGGVVHAEEYNKDQPLGFSIKKWTPAQIREIIFYDMHQVCGWIKLKFLLINRI
ncbi:hypothetical protein ACT4_052_00170 [Acinetobacter sp. NBRC 100985]|nr:hypothetical protein ACT4_052_00170 [Acinetobacter sp. NBRC 100985]